MKENFKHLQSTLLKSLAASLVLLLLLILGGDSLDRLIQGNLFVELIRSFLIMTLITSIPISVLGLWDLRRQRSNLRQLDQDEATDFLKAQSALAWPEGDLYLVKDHLLFLHEPVIRGVELRPVKAISSWFMSEDPQIGLLVIHGSGHLPALIPLVGDRKVSPQSFRQSLDEFLAALTRQYPAIHLGPTRIPSPSPVIWDDLRFVTWKPALVVLFITTLMLPAFPDLPLVSLLLTLPATWYWFRRFRLFQSIGRNTQFILEMVLFLGSLMLQGILAFKDTLELVGLAMLPMIAFLLIRNIWLKNTLLPPKN